jgi:hypothetical protein
MEDPGSGTFGVFANDGEPVVGKYQLGKGDRKVVGRSSPRKGLIWLVWRDFGIFRASCEKMGFTGASCRAGGI